MKISSEQHPRSGNNQVRKPGESVAIAAQVFSNYVFVPTRRLPKRSPGAGRLHGAALLVFTDEPENKVQLRTGYATHVAGDSILVPGEDVADQIVSSHKVTPRKESEMSTMIACSVCHAVIQPGATVCPGCGLQLVAQAVPVLVAKQTPLWWFMLKIILGIGVLVMLAEAFSH